MENVQCVILAVKLVLVHKLYIHIININIKIFYSKDLNHYIGMANIKLIILFMQII
jgi:hypothetical protein